MECDLIEDDRTIPVETGGLMTLGVKGEAMLEDIDFGEDLPREVYKPLKDELTKRLVLLQQRAISAKLPVIVVFEGWGGAGKGACISDLMVDLDARSCQVQVPSDPTPEDDRLPFMQRYWSKVGPHGTTTIFDRSWYHDAADRVLVETRRRLKASGHKGRSPIADLGEEDARSIARQMDSFIVSMTSFERQFADDGYLIVKFFLHISEEEQGRRLEALRDDPKTAWRVTKKDLRRHARYGELIDIIDRFLARTSYTYAPWYVVPAHYRRVTDIMVRQTLVEALEKALDQREAALAAPPMPAPESVGGLVPRFPLVTVPLLEDVTYDNRLTRAEYERELKVEQRRLARHHNDLYLARIPLMVAYEGWDAAGKGGNIKRLARALDARGYRVVPSAAPTPLEKEHPFLWRYWMQLPRTGHIAIYDRTWYGRVLVERVEGFATPEEWRRAYDEINEFECELQRWGAILLKFWIDVSPDEQLRRFHERQEDPTKQWKITDEDWRNREKAPLYRAAVDDMLRLTSTEYAPWTIVESDDKLYARIKVLRAVNEAIEQRLDS